MEEKMIQANIEILKAISHIRNGFLDALMLLLTELGTEIVVIGVVCILYWCINKHMACRIGMAFFASGILVQGLKVGFHIERPWVIDSTFAPVEAAKEGATGYSFPSGHTQGATALYGTLFTLTSRKWLKAIFIGLIALVAFNRLYLGVHTPLDVVTSALVSGICVFIFARLSNILETDTYYDTTVGRVLAYTAAILCMFSYTMAFIVIVYQAHINDCYKSGGAGLGFALGWFSSAITFASM